MNSQELKYEYLLTIDSNLYKLPNILQNLYPLCDDYYVHLEWDKNQNKYQINLEPKKAGKTDKDIHWQTIYRFENNLIHQALKTDISEKNKIILDAIVQRSIISFMSQELLKKVKTQMEQQEINT